MSASLIILIPLVLVGLVGALCFVGCVLPTTGLASPLGPYQGDTILGENKIVALYPLNDTLPVPAPPPPAMPTAQDLVTTPGPFNGFYNSAPSVPYDPVNQSAAAPGTFTLGQPGIVLGDVPQNSSTRSACAAFNGGFVSVPFNAALNPQTQFTVEAWVQPNWTDDDVTNFPATRVVVASAETSPAGYGLVATPDNFWSATVAVDANPNPMFFSVKSDKAITLGKNVTYYLAMTFDAGTGQLQLFVGDTSDSSFTPKPGTTPSNSTFLPVLAATPFLIGKGRADVPNGLLPFNGFIQDVAVYNTVLSDLNMHFSTGIGS